MSITQEQAEKIVKNMYVAMTKGLDEIGENYTQSAKILLVFSCRNLYALSCKDNFLQLVDAYCDDIKEIAKTSFTATKGN